ncbi:hypothetical protein TPHA_0F02390 [Tetrapisispora phaffii CBS 4417]|uniref:MARVEL domain-containing protein n=1 Tax=Tetrapisispora phaffii (strain ATCC 24235 / CBS 4417 / NBRC 1672 / NRRL Y-8282 / UCD 70-5) TaxID=1071381 RepID=G8BUD4_TETPH|nr:hypothetical protein TPHA_0F02390 [Tetrapisispora phaffii CBS 4417]CCE63720.1 hypothetical protein TPHA_0F02390 [Tetrapisispora phaffii CBS 4417]
MVSSFVTRTLPLTGLRLCEFAASVIVMSLLSFAIHEFGFHGSKKLTTGWLLVLSRFFILLAVIIGSLVTPGLVMAGLLLIGEFIMAGLWISAFIVIADSVGKNGCSNKQSSTYNPNYGSMGDYGMSGGTYNEFTGQYGNQSSGRACNSIKTSVAFAGLAAVLFIISLILVIVNIVVPVGRNYGGAGLFKTGSSMNSKVHRSSALTLSEPIEKTYAYETGAGVPQAGTEQRVAEDGVATNQVGNNVPVTTADQHTFSTGASSNDAFIQEKNTGIDAANAAHRAASGGTTVNQPNV